MNWSKVSGVLAAVGFLAAAAAKVFNGEAPNWTEVTLAVTTLFAAFGFQRG